MVATFVASSSQRRSAHLRSTSLNLAPLSLHSRRMLPRSSLRTLRAQTQLSRPSARRHASTAAKKSTGAQGGFAEFVPFFKRECLSAIL